MSNRSDLLRKVIRGMLEEHQGSPMTPDIFAQINAKVKALVSNEASSGGTTVQATQSPIHPTLAKIDIRSDLVVLGPDKPAARDYVHFAWVPLETPVGSLCPFWALPDSPLYRTKPGHGTDCLAIHCASTRVIHAVSEYGEGLGDLRGLFTRIIQQADPSRDPGDHDNGLDLERFVSLSALRLSGYFPLFRPQFATQITTTFSARTWASRFPKDRHLVRAVAFQDYGTKTDWLQAFPGDADL